MKRWIGGLRFVYGSILTFMFLSVFVGSQMSFDITGDALLGPGALVIGMVGAIVYLVRRDKELREQVSKQNDDLKKSQEARIKELEQEIRELRNR